MSSKCFKVAGGDGGGVAGGDGGEKGGGRQLTRDTVERYNTLAAVAGGISATCSSSAKFTTCRGSLRGADFLRFPLKAVPRRDMSEGFAQFLTMFMRLCVEHDASSSHVIGRLA